MVAQGGTCTIVHNPTGWHDGSGCLDWTPTGANPTIRALLTGNLPFNIGTDNGWGIEMMIPRAADETVNAYINCVLATGGVSAGSVPANNMDWRVYLALANAQSQKFNGVLYRRFRFDIANTDLKMGPVTTNTPIVGGTGITKYSLINWWCLYATGAWLNKTIKIKRVSLGGRSRPTLIVTLDNAYGKMHTRYLQPKFSDLKWNVAVQLLIDAWTSADVPSSTFGSYKEAVLSMWGSGADLNPNDIVDRSISSLDYATMYSAATSWQASAAGFGFAGIDRGQNFWVYNNNAYNDEPIRALKDAGYIAGRAGQDEGRFTFPEPTIKNSMRLGSQSWDNTTVQSMKDQIDRIIEYGVTGHVYLHKFWPKAQLAADVPAATVPGATETVFAYFNRVTGLSESATITYLNARALNNSLCSWVEDLDAVWDYAKTKETAGLLEITTPSKWAALHKLTAATP